MTYDKGLQAAIDLLSTRFPASRAHCSVAELVPCQGPTASAQLYIDKIERLKGGTGDGLAKAVEVLSTFGVRRGFDGWELQPVGQPDQIMSVYIGALLRP